MFTYEEKVRYIVEAETEEEAKKIAKHRDDNNLENDGECGGFSTDVYVADDD